MLITIIILVLSAVFFVNGKVRSDIVALCALIALLVFQILTSLSISFVNTKSMVYGDSVIAGMGAVTRIVSMGSLMVFGFIKGFQPIA